MSPLLSPQRPPNGKCLVNIYQMDLFNPHNNAERDKYFADVETEAQRGNVTCLRL